jgi:hypothetical protein
LLYRLVSFWASELTLTLKVTGALVLLISWKFTWPGVPVELVGIGGMTMSSAVDEEVDAVTVWEASGVAVDAAGAIASAPAATRAVPATAPMIFNMVVP